MTAHNPQHIRLFGSNLFCPVPPSGTHRYQLLEAAYLCEDFFDAADDPLARSGGGGCPPYRQHNPHATYLKAMVVPDDTKSNHNSSCLKKASGPFHLASCSAGLFLSDLPFTDHPSMIPFKHTVRSFLNQPVLCEQSQLPD